MIAALQFVLSVIISTIFSQFVKWLVITLVVIGSLGGVYIKGRNDEHAFMVRHEQAQLAQQKKEADDAIAAANAARERAEKKFTAPTPRHRPFSILPKRVHNGSDGFARD